MTTSVIDFAQAAQSEFEAAKMGLIEKANGLNYWGKRLDTSRRAVITILMEEFPDLQEAEIIGILRNATKSIAKKEKVVKEAKPDNRPLSAGTLSHDEESREVFFGKKFIITSCQNNTEVHLEFFRNLVAYANEICAELIIMPFLYNKNGFQSGENQKIWYAPELREYMEENDLWLGDNKKVFLAALNILPTAKRPLSGLAELMKSAECLIVPHATIAHDCLPVLGAQYGVTVPTMFSTGTVTQRNYIQQKSGQAASGRHCFGASIVEFNDYGQFWVRQIQTDESGEFCDLNNFVSVGTVSATNADTVTAISWGDIHAEKSDVKIVDAQWLEDGCALDYFKPSYQFCHDLLDFETLNHHNRDNNYHLLKNHVNSATVEGDLSKVSGILAIMSRPFCETKIVYSNHDDSLTRWLSCNKYNAFNDPANAATYYSLQAQAHKVIKNGGEFNPLPWALESLFNMIQLRENNIEFLKSGQSFKLLGVEWAEHGHYGINGSRGTKATHAGYKVTTGHTHSSSIVGGQYVSGVSGALNMGYNTTGASSWVHAFTVLYKTGQRTIIHLKPEKCDYVNDHLKFMA